MVTCLACAPPRNVAGHALMEHLRILHPVIYQQIERWPDGTPVVMDQTADSPANINGPEEKLGPAVIVREVRSVVDTTRDGHPDLDQHGDRPASRENHLHAAGLHFPVLVAEQYPQPWVGHEPRRDRLGSDRVTVIAEQREFASCRGGGRQEANGPGTWRSQNVSIPWLIRGCKPVITL